MPIEHQQPVAVPVPEDSAIRRTYASTNLADAYAIALPIEASGNPEVLARFIFDHQALWIGQLLKLRDLLVRGFGLKTAQQLAAMGGGVGSGRLSIFKLYSADAHEVVLGEDDKHLNFRLSVRCEGATSPGAERRLTLSTVVQCHNRLGRFYLALIAPFHRQVVQSSLRTAARVGWPTDADTREAPIAA